ncbi:grasp-with-spasm system ATP-grasp peptide maturase [Deminuibacter soli]|uniref:grasp-with-spasm system ATP-grasp peptide maturase n=1 Tax=Deminuibacter soli TaxID=2291815 RepID=UPI001313E2C7|nr:grasp-with-spasm system ATP-grasp peptide maturase [Deminuibacter soli]
MFWHKTILKLPQMIIHEAISVPYLCVSSTKNIFFNPEQQQCPENAQSMILLLSRQDDGSTALVIEWLIALRKKYIRVNSDTNRMKFVSFDIDKEELIIEQNGVRVNLAEVNSTWYRRRGFSMENISIEDTTLSKAVFRNNSHYHKTHMQSELKVMIEFIHAFVEGRSTKQIGNHSSVEVNKLKVLEAAKRCGLKIPQSFIVTTKADLVNIINTYNDVITKAISGQGVYFFTQTHHYYSYTEKIGLEQAAELPDTFFPSLFQTQIKKKYELRIFYLRGECYTMAIFSQGDKKTEVDFRKYNTKKPNRFVPYKLPAGIEQKLTKLMNELNLDTGSIDIIVDRNNEYYFLEVNPIGQFSMTSVPCNYYLEKKIAELL